ncbi:MAG: lamin tail domain-containing protein, partial [Bacteroidia bacterium]
MAFLLLHSGLNAQVSDDFSDGEFTSNPAWGGQGADFTVDNEQLRLNASATGESYISTQALWKDTASWACWFKMDFSPSTSNKLRIYLSFDRADLSSSGNGYFLEIGESGSVDNLELYRQSGSTVSLLAQGAESTLGGEPNECRILVTRSSTGKFQVNADFTGGTNLSLDFEATDQTFSEGEYFGFLCDYTSTRADKFYFDEVRIDPIFKDTKAPELLGLEVLDPKNIELTFSEALDSASAVSSKNYDLNGVEPLQATWNSSTAEKVKLEFTNPLVSGTNYTLKASGIKDLVANELTNVQKSFFYYLPTAGDLIINEVFPDPTPSQGLPENEFVELFNTTDNDIQLANWTISDASSTTSFDSFLLKAGEYLIICPNAAVANYSGYGNALGVSLPALNNGGDDVVLRAPNGT